MEYIDKILISTDGQCNAKSYIQAIEEIVHNKGADESSDDFRSHWNLYYFCGSGMTNNKDRLAVNIEWPEKSIKCFQHLAAMTKVL